MSKKTGSTFKSNITAIKISPTDFPTKEDISDLRLFNLLDIFSYRKDKNMDIFPSLTACIKEKAEDNKILLYLFLNTLEEKVKTSLLEITEDKFKKAIDEIEQQINNSSSSELPEPSLYKGWGFRFSEAGISEQNGKLYIKIDDIFEGSKLTECDVGKDNTIIIENPENFKKDGKFDIGKIAQHIRMQELLTAETSNKEEVKIKKDKKTYFYQDEENSKFMAFSIKEGISIEEAKNQEAVILAAHERVKNQLQDTTAPTTPATPPTTTPTNATQEAFGNTPVPPNTEHSL